jgi:hypothetical protein
MTAARSNSWSAAGTERMPSASADGRASNDQLSASRPRTPASSNSDGELRPDQVAWAACSRTGVGLEHGLPGDETAVRPDRPGGCDQCASTGGGLSIHPVGSSRRHLLGGDRRRGRNAHQECGRTDPVVPDGSLDGPAGLRQRHLGQIELASLWQTAVAGSWFCDRSGATRPDLLVCDGAPRRNRTGDPIPTIDARVVHAAVQYLTSPHSRAGERRC